MVPSRILTLDRKLHKVLFRGGLGHVHQDKFGSFGIVSDALRGKIMPRTVTAYIYIYIFLGGGAGVFGKLPPAPALVCFLLCPV